jgi:hypothetical protein
MKDQVSRLLLLVLMSVLPGSVLADDPPALVANPPMPAAKPAAAPRIKDRVYPKDLEGIWMASRYLEALKAARSPHAAAAKARPLVITIKKDGRSYPVMVTDFRKVALRALLDVEPYSPPGTFRLATGPDDRPTSFTDVIYIPFRGTRGSDGKFETLSVADPLLGKKKWADYVRLEGDLNALINRHTIAGTYQDEKGAAWEFSEAGDAVSPDDKFHFELSLEGSDANCEFMEIEDANGPDGKRRIGFAWHGKKLALHKVSLGKKPLVRCEAKPFALLTPAPR